MNTPSSRRSGYPVLLLVFIALMAFQPNVEAAAEPSLSLDVTPFEGYTLNSYTIKANITGSAGVLLSGINVTFSSQGVPGSFERAPPSVPTAADGVASISWKAASTPGNVTFIGTAQVFTPAAGFSLKANITVTVKNQLPVGYIDSVEPKSAVAGNQVSFKGHGTDMDGTVVGYRWASNVTGSLGLSSTYTTYALPAGTHLIVFQVQDDRGAWSKEVSAPVVISPQSDNTPTLILAGVVAAGVASAAGYFVIRKKPSLRRDVQDRKQKESEKEEETSEDEEEKKKKDLHRLRISAILPTSMSKLSFPATLRLRNEGTSTLKNVQAEVSTAVGITATTGPATIPEIRPGQSLELRFQFRIEKNAKRGIASVVFTVKTDQTAQQIDRHVLNIQKIGIVLDPGRAVLGQPLIHWLMNRGYNWETMPSTDDLLGLLRFDIIVAPNVKGSLKGSRNLSSYVEDGQSVFCLGPVESLEGGALTGLLGYSEPAQKTVKAGQATVVIIDINHPVTRKFVTGHRIPLGAIEGTFVSASTLVGKSLAVLEYVEEGRIEKIPAIVVNQYVKGRAAHFNFPFEKVLGRIQNILEDTLEWLLPPVLASGTDEKEQEEEPA